MEYHVHVGSLLFWKLKMAEQCVVDKTSCGPEKSRFATSVHYRKQKRSSAVLRLHD